MSKDLAAPPGGYSTPASGGGTGERMSTFSPRTVTWRGRVDLVGKVDDIFPLFSPAGERSWVPGWDPELLHPAGADWAQGQIFRTREELGEAVWIVSRLDRAAHEVEYYRVEPGRYVARIEVRCRPGGDRVAHAEISYSFVGLSERGNLDIDAMSQEAYDEKMARWAVWIENHLASARPPSSDKAS